MKFNIDNLIESGILLLIGIVIDVVVRYVMKKAILSKIDRSENTPFIMIVSYVKYFYFLLLALLILKVNGIDVSAMLAGVGLVGIIIGLAVQDALKDMIRGITIISEDYYKIGDVIKYKDNVGIVTELGVKTTKIKDLYTDNIVSIANRNIEQVEVVSDSIYLDIPMPYEVKIDKVEECIDEIISEIKKNPKVTNAVYKGVSNLSESSVDYKLLITASPKVKLQVRRDSLKTILTVMEKHKLSVPYRRLDIHNKD